MRIDLFTSNNMEQYIRKSFSRLGRSKKNSDSNTIQKQNHFKIQKINTNTETKSLEFGL